MALLQVAKQSEWYSMMDLLSGALITSLACTTTALKNGLTRRQPADAVASRRAALPPGVRLSALKFGLPLSHTRTTTENQCRMKVRCGPRNGFSAPITLPGNKVGSARVGPTDFTPMGAPLGAVGLIPFARTGAWFTAGLTVRSRAGDTPPVFQVASTRTKAAFWSSVKRIKGLPALLASLDRGGPCHTVSIPRIEIEERYCEIAAKRLSQEVLAF